MSEKGQKIFRPFLIEGDGEGKNIFRVVECDNKVSRENAENLLSQLPIRFQVRRDSSLSAESLNEPLEVRIPGGSIIYIHPPRHRILACTSFEAPSADNVIGKMHIDNVMDTTFPGNGQLRTCVHFNPKIFGIRNWADTGETELEVDIHVYPKDTVPEIRAPRFGKWDVRSLLEMIAGGENYLSMEQLKRWRELIMFAVKSMRSCYENPDTAEDYPIRVYYKPYWAEIEAVGEDDKKLVIALEQLRCAIQME